MRYDDNCLFCKIIRGEIPSDRVYEDDDCYAFRDINPQAPTHILVVPKTHLASAAELGPEQGDLVGKLFAAISAIARQEGVAEKGFRVITNAGPDAGQTVPHLHFHILAGTRMGERML